MSNPDIKTPTFDSLTTALPVAIFLFLITITLFQFKSSILYFNYILWIGFPIITVIIVGITNIINQYIACKTVNVGKALLGALPSMGTVLVGLLVSYTSYCRIPIASVFTPLLIGEYTDIVKGGGGGGGGGYKNSLKNSNSKECCTQNMMSLESVESRYPLIEGISYGFYMFFSILFGVVMGTGLSTIC